RRCSARASPRPPSRLAAVHVAVVVPAVLGVRVGLLFEGAEQRQLRRGLVLLDRDRVLVREAGIADAVLQAARRAPQALEAQVAERVDADRAADLLDAHARSDQLGARRAVTA